MQEAGECEYPCWQPIETAPKDGTAIIGLFDGKAIECSWWVPPAVAVNTRAKWDPIWLDSHGCGCCGEDDGPPTHWIPLPEPPQE